MRLVKPKIVLACVLAAGVVLLQQAALAIGLGRADVNSYLNQPLDVTIPLLSVSEQELELIEVGLADAEDFTRLGLARPASLAGLEFEVLSTGAGPVIHVTSEAPVREPFLTMLLRLEWPQGQILREFTVLLDPPVTMPAATPQPALTEAAPVDRPESAAREARPLVETPAVIRAGGEYGPVAAGETLWDIASATRPAGVSVNQMMLALLRTNPQAFYENNINALKRGAVLQVPSAAQIRQLSATEVMAQVERQHALWQDYRTQQAQSPATVVEGGEAAPAVAVADEPASARLEVVPADAPEEDTAGDTAAPGSGGAAAASEAAALRNELARTREELLARREQMGAMDTRVAELEQQVAQLQRLLELKNNELAALQSQVAESAQRPAPGDEAQTRPAGPEATDRADAVDEPRPLTPESAAPLGADETAPAAGAGTDTKTGAAEPAAQVQAGEESEPASWVERLLSPLAVGLFGLILIAVGVALFLYRRREDQEADAWGNTTVERKAFPAEESAIPEEPAEAPPREEAQPVAEETDADSLESAVASDPADQEARLQLLSFYASTEDREAFVAEAETLYAELADPSDPVWQKAREMGEKVAPDHPLFGGEDDIRSAATEEIPAVPADEPQAAGEAGLGEPERLSDVDPGEPSDEEPSREYELPGLELEAEGNEHDERETPPGGALPQEESEAGFELGEPELDSGADEPEFAAEDFGDDVPAVQDTDADENAAPVTGGDDDAIATKLELAEAYLEMGDHDGAKGMLDEVLQDGNDTQKAKAQELLKAIA